MTCDRALVPAGQTLGVEEEYHLADATTLDLVSPADLALRLEAAPGGALHAEMLASQLEAVTDVCSTLPHLRAELVRMRGLAAAAAAEYGAVIIASSTHPFAKLEEAVVLPRPRYQQLIDRFGAVVGEFNLCACHVHVSVPDLDTAIQVLNHARAYLPVLSALTSSSPFHEGIDTGFQSFRVAQLALWPQGGIPPYLHSAEEYRSLVDQLVGLGMIADGSMLLWDLRPSTRYPTLEFRIGDVTTDVDDAVLYAGLVRSLVRVLAQRVAEGQEAKDPGELMLRAARWRAARWGLRGGLWSFSKEKVVPAFVAVGELWAELEADLRDHDEASLLRGRLDTLVARGSSAAQQRSIHSLTDDVWQVARELADVTVREVDARTLRLPRTSPV